MGWQPLAARQPAKPLSLVPASQRLRETEKYDLWYEDQSVRNAQGGRKAFRLLEIFAMRL